MPDMPRYGTWIRPKKLALFWLLAGLLLGTAGLGALSSWFLLLALPGLAFLYIAVVVTLTAWRFSPRGGDVQNRIHDLLLSHKKGTGSTLDVGCGSGHLVIASAQRDSASPHVGLDSWGEGWQYAEEQCAVNARLEGANNLTFVNASAARTGLEDGAFRYVFSCLTFHEVRGETDKTTVIQEALRLLEQGGTYAFLDLFDNATFYPSQGAVADAIRRSGCSIEVTAALSELMPLPYPLRGTRALRYARLISGKKVPAEAAAGR